MKTFGESGGKSSGEKPTGAETVAECPWPSSLQAVPSEKPNRRWVPVAIEPSGRTVWETVAECAWPSSLQAVPSEKPSLSARGHRAFRPYRLRNRHWMCVTIEPSGRTVWETEPSLSARDHRAFRPYRLRNRRWMCLTIEPSGRTVWETVTECPWPSSLQAVPSEKPSLNVRDHRAFRPYRLRNRHWMCVTIEPSGRTVWETEPSLSARDHRAFRPYRLRNRHWMCVTIEPSGRTVWETVTECAWPSSLQAVPSEKPSCHRDGRRHVGSGVLWKTVQSTVFCDGTVARQRQEQGRSAHMWRCRRCGGFTLEFWRDICRRQDDAFSQELRVCFSRTMPGLVLCLWSHTSVQHRRHRVRVLDWPACSPDRSPNEHVWRIMKRRIRQRRPRTVEQLKSCIHQERAKIPLAKL